MANHSGKTGGVIFGSATIGVGNWKLDTDCHLGETTNSGTSGWATYIAGVKKWSVSFELPWDDSALVSSSYTPGTSGAATFQLGDSTKTLTGTVIIEKVGFEDDAVEGNPVKVNVAGKGSGALTMGG